MTARRPRRSGDSQGARARERVVAIVDRLPEGSAVEHGDHLSLEVRKKRFGWFLADHHGDGRLAVHCKATPAGRQRLLSDLPHQAHVPKYVGHRGWVGLWLDVPGVDWPAVRDALVEAYRTAAPKTLLAELDSPARSRRTPGDRGSGGPKDKTSPRRESSSKQRAAVAPARRSAGAARGSAAPTAEQALAWLERHGTKKQIAELDRYGITATRPFGVSVGSLKSYAKELGQDHDLARGLWASGRYEARLLAIFVEEPARVTAKQMDAWIADSDNWALVDTACFHLFDRTPHAWKKTEQWARSSSEFTKRAAFALLWSLSVHDKNAPDHAFMQALALVERAAPDERHLVKKAVNMALRAIGKRNPALHAAAILTAKRLAEHDATAPRWIGKHALRELQSPTVRKRLGR